MAAMPPELVHIGLLTVQVCLTLGHILCDLFVVGLRCPLPKQLETPVVFLRKPARRSLVLPPAVAITNDEKVLSGNSSRARMALLG